MAELETPCQTKGCRRKVRQSGRGRPRKFCLGCRPPEGAFVPTVPSTAKLVALPTRPKAEPKPQAREIEVPAPPPVEAVLTASTYAELEAADRVGTAKGVAALVAAAAIDRGGHPAAGLAALIKAHREALTAALEGAQTEADALDRLGDRRAERFA